MPKDPFATSDLVKIGDAARIVGVSIDTLRRWEKAGKITPIRTPGGTRLYSIYELSDINPRSIQYTSPAPSTQELLDRKAQEESPVILRSEATKDRSRMRDEPETSSEILRSAQNDISTGPRANKFLTASLLTLTLLILGLSFYFFSPLISLPSLILPTVKIPQVTSLPPFERDTKEEDLRKKLVINENVLAATSIAREGRYLEFNADTVILGDLAVEGAGTFTENLTAPNVLYDVLPGSGIAITEGQTPTISSTDTLATVTTRGSVTTTGITLGDVLNMGSLSSDPSSASNGATYYNTSSNKFRCYINKSWADCDTNTTSSGDITAVSVGNGLSGGGSSGDVTIDLDVTTTSTSSTTSANSGLEATSTGLRLLGGCSNNQVLQWSSSSVVWQCATSGGDFTLAGDSGTSQTISASNTLTVAGGTNGIDTVAGSTDTITLNLDTTEIGTSTFGSGSAFTWTFDAGSSDPLIAFTSNQISLGSAVQSTITAFTVIDNPAITATSNQNFYKTLIDNSAAVTISASTTSSIVASLAIDEPNITATGTVTNAATLYLSGAPTEGSSGNFALWVDDGESRFENTPVSGSTAGRALTVVPTYIVEATDLTLSGIRVALDTNSNTDSGDTAFGVNVDDITTTSGPTEYGLRIGSGYDYQFFFELGTRDLRVSATAPSAGTSPLTATIPAVAADDTFCLATLANCTGGGGGTGVTFTGQTTNALTKFTSTTGQITSSNFTDDGTTMTLAANINLTMTAGTGSITANFSPAGTSSTVRALTVTPTFGIDVTDQTLSGVYVNPNTNTNTDTGDVLNGILIDAITASSATEYGLQIGSGWDSNLYFNDTTSRVLLANGGTIVVHDGTNTLCTITDAGTTGDLTCTGSISGGSSGTQGFWSRTSTTLSPATANDIVSIANTTTTGADLAITNTGAYTGTGIFNLTANSATTGNIAVISGTGMTTGEILDITGTWAPTNGSTNEAIDLNITHSPTTSADNFQAINLTTTDGTALGNTVYNLQGTLTLTGNAAKTGIGDYQTVTSSSTTGDTLVAFDAASTVTGIIGGATTRSVYGLRSQPTAGAESTAGTTNVYGVYSNATGDVGVGGTFNAYGLYVANGTYDTDGTSTAYGIYIEDITGADTNIELAFASTSPTVTIGNTGTLSVTDGTNTLFSIADDTSEGDVTVTGDLAVNGATSADITSSTTTATILNTTVTTLSIGGAATTFNIGTTDSVTRTINLGTGTGADTINIGTGATNADTLTFGNTGVATTFNFDTGAATVDAFDIAINSLTTGLGFDIDANALTTGNVLDIASTSTALTSGRLVNLNWSPGSSTTATGDLFRLTIGTSGTTTGYLFNIVDTTTSIFSLSEVALTTSQPANFTAAGDVSIAYDIVFTNPTASYIKSQAPLILAAGETFNSSNLTLQTYNAGSVVVESASSTSTSTNGVLRVNDVSNTTSAVGLYVDFDTGTTVAAAADQFLATFDMTQNDADGDLFGIFVNASATSATLSGVNYYECLICLENDENTAAAVADAIRITSTGATAGSFTTGLDFDTTDVTTDIEFQNDETLDNNTDGTLTLSSSGTSANVLAVGALSAGVTVAGSATPLRGISVDLATNYTTADDDTTGVLITLDATTDSDATVDDLIGLSVTGSTVTVNGTSAAPVWRGVEVTIPEATTTTGTSYTGDGIRVTTPTDTQSTALTTTYNGFNISSAGALTQDTAAGTITWRGANITMPALTETTGTVSSTGLFITSGAVGAGAEALGIDMADTDITTDIRLQNSETIDNDTNGTVDISGELVIFLDGDAVTTAGLCGNQGAGDVADTDNIRISDCSGTPADIAEWYGADSSVDAGDIVVLTDQTFQYDAEGADPYTGQVKSLGKQTISILGKANSSNKLLGVISTGPIQVIGEDIKKAIDASGNPNIKPVPVALAGRVPVKVSDENGQIDIGDYLTSSSTPGVAMKATRPGQVIGKAMENFTPTSPTSPTYGKIIAFVNVSYADPNQVLANLLLDQNGNLVIPKLSTASIQLSSNLSLQTPTSQLPLPISNPQPIDLIAKLQVVDDAIATQSARLASLEAERAQLASQQSALDSLQQTIASLTSPTSPTATASAQPLDSAQDVASLHLTPPETLLATGSATLADLKVTETFSSEKLLTALDAEVSGIFRVFGETFLGNTTIAGDLVVDGTFSISQNSLNALTTLYLQNNPLAQNIDIFNGLVTIDQNGLLVAQTITASEYQIVEGQTSGSGTLAAGTNEVPIFNSKVGSNSRILITLTSLNSPTSPTPLTLAVTEKVPGAGFVVTANTPTLVDITFDYWIINEVAQRGTP